MPIYDIEAPVIIEFVSPLDRYDFSSDRTPNLCASLTLDDVECHMERLWCMNRRFFLCSLVE